MKLYVTPGSPYARMARIVVLEKKLAERVEIIAAQTRVADSPYYRINPSGRRSICRRASKRGKRAASKDWPEA